MPRIKAIIREIGTTGDKQQLTLTGSVHADVATAVRAEHYCDEPSCDVAVAWENDFPLAAAQVLQGATETPLLDAVLNHYADQYTEHLPADEEAWGRYHKEHGRECESCGSYTYGTDSWTPTECGNCGAGLTS